MVGPLVDQIECVRLKRTPRLVAGRQRKEGDTHVGGLGPRDSGESGAKVDGHNNMLVFGGHSGAG